MNKHNAKDYISLIEALADGKTIMYEIEDENWVELERYYFSAPVEKYKIKDSEVVRENYSGRNK